MALLTEPVFNLRSVNSMREPVIRNLAALARERARRYPTLTITGPRQSGKTTLCRLAFPDGAGSA